MATSGHKRSGVDFFLFVPYPKEQFQNDVGFLVTHFMLSYLALPFRYLERGAVRTLRFLGRGARTLIYPKGRTRMRLVLVAALLVALWGASFAYPVYWNQAATWTNDRIAELNLPQKAGNAPVAGDQLRLVAEAIALPTIESQFSLGLDLRGGVHLVYEADLSDIEEGDETEAMGALRDIIERRVNFLGVSEPVVQVQASPGEDAQRLVVELAGIEDPEEAIEQIGQTPFLQFKEPRAAQEQVGLSRQIFSNEFMQQLFPQATQEQIDEFCVVPQPQLIGVAIQITGTDPCFEATELTGKFLERASVTTNPTTAEVQISLDFDEEGARLFGEITGRNVGSQVAIYLDNQPISIPRVDQAIAGGQAVITGAFTLAQARELATSLNAGALPVPITLVSQQRVGATLGEESLEASLRGGILGLLAVVVFLVVVYRVSGVLAVLSLAVYLIFLLALLKFIPVTLTLAGIAGLVLSIGMAVDANILVFERLREEVAGGPARQSPDGSRRMAGRHDSLRRAIDRAFARAWPSVRDGNVSTLLTAAILFFLSTSFVQGFALVLALGILISMFSSMILTKYLMKMAARGALARRVAVWIR